MKPDTRGRDINGVCRAASDGPPQILIVDSERETRETLTAALIQDGFMVEAASSAEEAIAKAGDRLFDFAILGLQLPDRPGLDVARVLVAGVGHGRFVLIGNELTVSTSVEAMKLGAVDVLEKPIAVDTLLGIVRNHTIGSPHHGPSSTPVAALHPIRVPEMCGPPRSAAQRWTMHVLKACQCEDDLKTLKNWAKSVGVSYSSLCESCRLLGIRPHDARDFVRALWVVVRCSAEQCAPETLLDVSDRRTLRAFLEKAGPRFISRTPTIDQFLRDQRFIPYDNEGVRTIRRCFRCPSDERDRGRAPRPQEGGLFRGDEEQPL
jgi:ActR/RegA family two-component response regulator